MGNNIFHPTPINWSYRGLGSDARRSMKKHIKKPVFRKNHTKGGKKEGPSHPPKNNMVMSEDKSVTPRYSPTKNIPNFIPEYSE